MNELKTLKLNEETFDSFRDQTARAELTKIPAVTGATVGQTVRIAAVDDDGVPTAWEPVDLPSGGDAITAPVDLIASGTIPAGHAAYTQIGDIGVTWGDLKQYKSIGILWNNGTDWATLFIGSMVVYQPLQLSTTATRSYTIIEFADTAKSKIQFKISALSEFWFVDQNSVTNVARWHSGGGAAFNPSIVTITYGDTDSLTLYLDAATTVESTWYIFGLTK